MCLHHPRTGLCDDLGLPLAPLFVASLTASTSPRIVLAVVGLLAVFFDVPLALNEFSRLTQFPDWRSWWDWWNWCGLLRSFVGHD